METQTSSTKWAGASIFAAIAASLCCITPVLALLAGTSGMASTFSWMEPFRPYLLGLTVAILGFAWYQKLKPRTAAEIDCDCEEDGKPPFMQTKSFLGIVTVFAVLMTAFPMYAGVFYPDNSKEVVVVDKNDIRAASFDIKGMTCTGCEEHVKHGVNELDGIIEATATYTEGTATVKFDASKVALEEVIKAIDATGYKVTNHQVTSD